jgi:hypothetical protein
MLRGEENPTVGNLSKLARSLGFRLSLVPVDSNGKPVKVKPKAKSGKTTSKKVKKVA